MSREIRSEKIRYYVLFPQEQCLLNCRATFLKCDQVPVRLHSTIFSWISKVKCYEPSFLSAFDVSFFCPERQESAFSPFILRHRLARRQGHELSAPFPLSLRTLLNPLPPDVYPLPCVYCCHEDSHCYIICDHYFSKVDHGLLSHALTCQSHIMSQSA